MLPCTYITLLFNHNYLSIISYTKLCLIHHQRLNYYTGIQKEINQYLLNKTPFGCVVSNLQLQIIGLSNSTEVNSQMSTKAGRKSKRPVCPVTTYYEKISKIIFYITLNSLQCDDIWSTTYSYSLKRK